MPPPPRRSFRHQRKNISSDVSKIRRFSPRRPLFISLRARAQCYAACVNNIRRRRILFPSWRWRWWRCVSEETFPRKTFSNDFAREYTHTCVCLRIVNTFVACTVAKYVFQPGFCCLFLSVPRSRKTSIIRLRRLPFMTIVMFRALCSDNVFRRKIPSPSGVSFDGRRNSAVHVQRRTTRVAGRALSIPRAVNVKTINVRVSDHFLPANFANFSSVRQSRTAFISVINVRQNFSFRGRKIRIHFHNLHTSLTIRGICPSSP